MRKPLFLTVGCVIGLWMWGQNRVGNDQKRIDFNKSAPQFIDPSVSKMHQVSQFGMTHYTGRANISIPIYTIKEGNITIPIALNYDTSGVKAIEQASNVGLNWSLSGTGSVIRSIKGVDDFAFVGIRLARYGLWRDRIRTLYSTSPYNEQNVGWMYLKQPLPEKDLLFPIEAMNALYRDPEADEYIVSAPGLTTRFIFDQDRNPINLNAKNHKIYTQVGNIDEYHNYDLYDGLTETHLTQQLSNMPYRYYLKDVKDIEIINTQGIRYKFNVHDIVQSVDIFSPYLGNRWGGSIYSRHELNQFVFKYQHEYVNAHHLKTITDIASGKKIEYIYEKYQRRSNDYDYNNKIEEEFLKGPFTLEKAADRLVMNPSVHRLKEIRFPKGKVVFTYGLSRRDWQGEKAITSIQIYNSDDVLLKSFELFYSYFSNHINRKPFHGAYYTRLKLMGINIKGGKSKQVQHYSFEYNEEKPIPPRFYVNADYMGYINKNTEDFTQKEIPKVYYSLNHGMNSVLPFKKFSSNGTLVVNPSGFSLEPNERYAKLGILKKIIHPTGGTNELEYELNRFQLEGKEYYGAGLRVKKQIISDGNGHYIEENYDYTDQGKTTGRFNGPFPVFGSVHLNGSGDYTSTHDPDLSREVSIILYERPKNGYQLFSNNFVGYNKVTVTQKGIDHTMKGKTVYEYTNIDEYPIVYSNIYVADAPFDGNVWGCAAFSHFKEESNVISIRDHVISLKIGFSYKNGGLPIRVTTPIYKLGHLKKVQTFNAFNDLLKEKNIIYQLFTNKKYPYKVCYNPFSFSNDKYLPAVIAYIKSSYDAYAFLKESEQATEWFDGEKIEQETRNTYNEQSFLQSQTTTNSKNQIIETTYQYAHDLSDQRLIDENRIATPLKTTVKKDGKILSQQQTKYSTFKTSKKEGKEVVKSILIEPKTPQEKEFYEREKRMAAYDGSLYLPQFVLAKKGSVALSENHDKKITYDRYDAKGNLLQYHTENGLTTSLLWDNKGEYPIAKVEGAAYSQISRYQSHPEDLRTALPKARVTTYTYRPLVGITSITKPNGQKERYEYDEFNRLKTVKDHKGKILRQYEYHYRNSK